MTYHDVNLSEAMKLALFLSYFVFVTHHKYTLKVVLGAELVEMIFDDVIFER